jgi:hypothetical protein
MNRPQKRDALVGYAVAAAVGIVALIVVSLVGMSEADAGGYRQRAVCNVVRAPVYQQAAVIAYPGVIGYQVGQALQQQAVDEHGFRASPSQQRLTFLEGYYEATQRLTDSAVTTGGPPQPDTAGHPPATEEGQITEEPQAFSAPQPPTAPVEPQRFLESTGEPLPPGSHESFSEAHPTLAASCKGCHADDESKGGFGMSAVVAQAKAEGDCETLLAIADSIATGRMPEGKPLSDADARAAIVELLSKPQ